jgi:hypothetical protein
MLEDTILKIGGLLQVSFGEAGADVLKKNMGTITVERLDPNSAARQNFCPGSVSTGPHG